MDFLILTDSETGKRSTLNLNETCQDRSLTMKTTLPKSSMLYGKANEQHPQHPLRVEISFKHRSSQLARRALLRYLWR